MSMRAITVYDIRSWYRNGFLLPFEVKPETTLEDLEKEERKYEDLLFLSLCRELCQPQSPCSLYAGYMKVRATVHNLSEIVDGIASELSDETEATL